MSAITELFLDLDRSWDLAQSGKVELKIIGCGALLLQLDYERGTRDADVFETIDLRPDVQARLAVIAGPGTPLHSRRRMYLEVVRNGIPFLPHAPNWNAVNLELNHFTLFALDPVDVVVSKLKRFNANDHTDIRNMIVGDYVAHGDVIARFRSAVDDFATDARAPDLPRIIDHLHEVERNLFVVAETDIELPSWL